MGELKGQKLAKYNNLCFKVKMKAKCVKFPEIL